MIRGLLFLERGGGGIFLFFLFFFFHNKTFPNIFHTTLGAQKNRPETQSISWEDEKERKKEDLIELKKGRTVPGERASRWMVLGVRGWGVAWLRPGQGSWSREESACVAGEVSDRRGSELGWARSSEPVSGGRDVWGYSQSCGGRAEQKGRLPLHSPIIIKSFTLKNEHSAMFSLFLSFLSLSFFFIPTSTAFQAPLSKM